MRALIVDDEPLLRHHLDQRLADLWPELEVVGKAGDGASGWQLLETLPPDLLFLDIRMPGMDGLQLAARLPALPRPPQLVFVTAYDEHAVRAFELAAVDYLLKPVSDERLLQTRARLLAAAPSSTTPEPQQLAALLAALGQLPAPAAAPPLRWLRVAKGEETLLLDVAEVSYFQAEDKYTSVYTAHGCFLMRLPLKELLAQLDGSLFWQIHRSTIVRVAAIQRISRDLAGRMFVHLHQAGVKLAVSRACQGLFKQM